MFEKDLHIAYLLDFYGSVLQDKVKRVMEAYYNEDFSLSEIAEGEEISRQGVRHLIKRGEEQLHFWETRLGLAAHYSEMRLAADDAEGLIAKRMTAPEEERDLPLLTVVSQCVRLMRNS